jgi:hypothetical protein
LRRCPDNGVGQLDALGAAQRYCPFGDTRIETDDLESL